MIFQATWVACQTKSIWRPCFQIRMVHCAGLFILISGTFWQTLLLSKAPLITYWAMHRAFLEYPTASFQHSLSIHRQFTEHSVCTLSTFTEHPPHYPLSIHWTLVNHPAAPTEPLLNLRWASIEHSLSIHWAIHRAFFEHPLSHPSSIHWAFAEQWASTKS